MKKANLIKMLKKDLADEHAAIIRYLVHGWLEGEDTPIGSNLISRSREEMWHMHWLGMSICMLGGEPDFTPAEYPFDPTNRSTIIKSYIEYEERLVPHYYSEAEMVDDPHIKRVLEREAWESEIHAKKFQRLIEKLTQEEANGSPGSEQKLPTDVATMIQEEVTKKYHEMLQHIRYSWVFQDLGLTAWQLMDQAMEKMKHVAHFAEVLAENGNEPKFIPGFINMSKSINNALKRALRELKLTNEQHAKFKEHSEIKKHKGMLINIDLTIKQEKYQIEEINDLLKQNKR